MVFTLPYLTSPHLTLPYLTLPYLTLPYLTLPYLTLPYLTLPYLTLPYLTLPYLTLPYLTLPYLLVYLFANFSCLCSRRYAFQPISKLCVPSWYTISRFLMVFYVLSGSGSGSPCGTTPSILVPIPPPPPPQQPIHGGIYQQSRHTSSPVGGVNRHLFPINVQFKRD